MAEPGKSVNPGTSLYLGNPKPTCGCLTQLPGAARGSGHRAGLPGSGTVLAQRNAGEEPVEPFGFHLPAS